MSVIKDPFPHSLSTLSRTAALACSVTSVFLDCRPRTTNLYYWYPDQFTHYLSGFTRLTKVSVTCPLKPEVSCEAYLRGEGIRDEHRMIDSEWQEDIMEHGLEKASAVLGVQAKLARVFVDRSVWFGRRADRTWEDRDVWVWVSGEGKALNAVELPSGLRMV